MNTFPTWVYGATRIGVPPQVNVWGTILFLVGIIVASLNLAGVPGESEVGSGRGIGRRGPARRDRRVVGRHSRLAPPPTS